jgi:anti-sigma factor RsiW
MQRTDDCGANAAAYVLGALDPEEAGAFKRHLETCIVCRDEVETLRQVADVLPMAAPQHPAPRALRRRVMAEVHDDARARKREHQRLRRPGFVAGFSGLRAPAFAAAAACIVAVAAFAGVELTGGSGSTHVYAASLGDAQVRIVGGHAELIVHRLAQPSAGHIYEVWLKRGTGQPAPTKALFSVTSTGDGDVDVPGDLHGVSTVMVTQEPDGGTQVPTTSPVIVAPLT